MTATRAAIGLALGFTLLAGAAIPASASNVYVNPIRLVLGGAARTAALTVKNTSTEALRLQLSVFAWAQDATGQMQLSPTQDIVFFPRLVTLAAGEQRMVRVGTSVPPADVERAYRLFVEELPPLETESAALPPGLVRVRARLGIPIFAPPPRGRAEPRLSALAARDGRVTFELDNPGTVHVAPPEVRVRGLDAGGGVVWERALESWYVLARGVRAYAIELDPRTCGATARIAVDVQAAAHTAAERLDLPPGACPR